MNVIDFGVCGFIFMFIIGMMMVLLMEVDKW
jgi:hypothetical protein